MNQAFVTKPAAAEILEKYHITEDEYQEVCEILVCEFAGWDEAMMRPYIQAVPAFRASQSTDIAEYRRSRGRRGARRYGNAGKGYQEVCCHLMLPMAKVRGILDSFDDHF